jgi:hypothetical protein
MLEVKGQCLFYLNRILTTFKNNSNVLSEQVPFVIKVVDLYIKNTKDLSILQQSLELAALVKSMLNDPFIENGFEDHIKNALDIKYRELKKLK